MKSLDPRYPVNGTFELTLRCNLRCKMCMFRHANAENARLSAGELTASQWISLAKQVFDAGTLNLLITGGEPMIRKDFCRIYEGIYKTGFLITLYTNATLVTDQVMEVLEKYPPHRIGITLYGASNETYERVTGCPDGFDRAMAGIKQLQRLPSVLDFRTTLVKDSVQDADAIEKLVQEQFGSTVTHTSRVFGSVRGGCCQPEECRLSPEENWELTYGRVLRRVQQLIPAELQDGAQLRVRQEARECQKGQTRHTLLGCSAGMDSYTITWDGKLLGCQMLGSFWTDAIAEGFAKAWEQFPFAVRLPQENATCEACGLRQICTVCPAVRMAECKNLTDIPQYICQCTKFMERMGFADEKRV